MRNNIMLVEREKDKKKGDWVTINGNRFRIDKNLSVGRGYNISLNELSDSVLSVKSNALIDMATVKHGNLGSVSRKYTNRNPTLPATEIQIKRIKNMADDMNLTMRRFNKLEAENKLNQRNITYYNRYMDRAKMLMPLFYRAGITEVEVDV